MNFIGNELLDKEEKDYKELMDSYTNRLKTGIMEIVDTYLKGRRDVVQFASALFWITMATGNGNEKKAEFYISPELVDKVQSAMNPNNPIGVNATLQPKDDGSLTIIVELFTKEEHEPTSD